MVNGGGSEGDSGHWVSPQGTLHERMNYAMWTEALEGEMREHLPLPLPTEVNV